MDGKKQIVVVCWRCERIGVYSRERFQSKFGDPGPGALSVIAQAAGCERAFKDVRELSDRCGIVYYRPDLR